MNNHAIRLEAYRATGSMKPFISCFHAKHLPLLRLQLLPLLLLHLQQKRPINMW